MCEFVVSASKRPTRRVSDSALRWAEAVQSPLVEAARKLSVHERSVTATRTTAAKL